MGVDGPIQFGPILTAMVIYLHAAHFLPERQVADIMRGLLKVSLSPATVRNRCRRAAKLIAHVFQNLPKQVAQGEEPKHLDETGFRMGGRLWWLHVMNTLTLACYRISATRGQMFELLQGRVVHDGWPSYAKLSDLIHGYSIAHLLRDLPAAIKQGESCWCWTDTFAEGNVAPPKRGIEAHLALRTRCYQKSIADITNYWPWL